MSDTTQRKIKLLLLLFTLADFKLMIPDIELFLNDISEQSLFTFPCCGTRWTVVALRNHFPDTKTINRDLLDMPPRWCHVETAVDETRNLKALKVLWCLIILSEGNCSKKHLARII